MMVATLVSVSSQYLLLYALLKYYFLKAMLMALLVDARSSCVLIVQDKCDLLKTITIQTHPTFHAYLVRALNMLMAVMIAHVPEMVKSQLVL